MNIEWEQFVLWNTAFCPRSAGMIKTVPHTTVSPQMWCIKSIKGWFTRPQTCWQDFIKFEVAQIHFLSDVFVAVAAVVHNKQNLNKYPWKNRFLEVIFGIIQNGPECSPLCRKLAERSLKRRGSHVCHLHFGKSPCRCQELIDLIFRLSLSLSHLFCSAY